MTRSRLTGSPVIGMVIVLMAVGRVAAVEYHATADRFTLHNAHVGFAFDASRGTYVLRAGDRVVVSEASFAINDWTSTSGDLRFTCQHRPVQDALGSGRAATIIARRPDGVGLILEVTLYEGASFVTLCGGLGNDGGEPVRIASITPLQGLAYAGWGTNERFSMLDGNGGGELTRVTHGDSLSCRNNLLVTFGPDGDVQSLVLGGLTYDDFDKYARAERQAEGVTVAMWAQDPIGKRVDPGTRYVPRDRFYLDFGTSCPFAALEAYGSAVRAAQQIELAPYTFPTVCMWFVGTTYFGNGWADKDTSAGAVWELEQAKARGLLEYVPLAVRVVPDTYATNNDQGWWDDEHWQEYGHYVAPYETTAKWGRAVIERGGIPLTYFQTAMRSEDYVQAHPDQMRFNDPNVPVLGPDGKPIRYDQYWELWRPGEIMKLGYDFTDKAFRVHMREVYANLRAGGVRGLMFDYPTTGWPEEGGLDDAYATAASAYRMIFALAKEGLGEPAYIHERNLSRGSDVTLGLVTSQRTMGDTARLNPQIVTTPALRWYKNRVVVNYDMDGKSPEHVFPQNRDGVRSMLTMAYAASGRFLSAVSIASLTEKQLRDLTRIFPFHSTAQSARPVDAFLDRPFPQVYDFAVTPRWHQVTLYNTALSAGQAWPASWTEVNQKDELTPTAQTIRVSLSAPNVRGGLGLDPTASYHVYDFWNDCYVGRLQGRETLEQHLRPHEARMLALHAVEPHPQFISTNRHVMQGYVDLVDRPQWDATRRTLSGASRVVANDTYELVIATNGHAAGRPRAAAGSCRLQALPESDDLVKLIIESPVTQNITWTVAFAD